jgi:putative peptide zinc metalloprotease protein
LVNELWELLVSGAQIGQLAERLSGRRPVPPQVIAKLVAFLNQLRAFGLLENSNCDTLSIARRIKIPIDPLANTCATLLRRLNARLLAGIMSLTVLTACSGLLVFLFHDPRPSVTQLRQHFTLAGALSIVFAIIPLHELGHAIACRFVGIPVSEAGLRFGVLGIPRPYVDTSLAWGIEERNPRLLIPCGGPFADLLIGGLAAWFSLTIGSASGFGSLAWIVAMYALVAISVGTSPLPIGDGSHILEALLNDDFARTAALFPGRTRFVRPRSVLIYRSACAAHVLSSGALLYLLR